MRIGLGEHFTLKKLFIFVLPSIIMMVFTSIYSVVDGLFVSNFAGEEAVAAINLIYPLFMVFGSIGFMIGAGGSALVSKTLGEGDKEKANKYFSMLVYITAGIGIVIAVAGQLVVEPVARLLGAESGKVFEYCVLYGRILLGTQPCFIIQNIFQSFFVTAEKPRLGLIATASAGVLNIVLDAIFVAGCGWGLLGAAVATAVSQIYGKAFLKACTNGSSEFFSNVSSAVVVILYNFQIQAILGDELGKSGVAAYGSIMYVAMIFFAMFMGYAVGSAPLMGYNYGARNRAEMKNLFKKSVIIMAVAGLAMFGVSEGLAYPFMKMFGYSEQVFEMALRGFRIYSVVFLTVGINMYGSALFTSLNNGLVSALISFLRSVAFQVTAVMVLPIFIGLDGVWSAAIVAEILSLIVTGAFVIAYHKKYGYYGKELPVSVEST